VPQNETATPVMESAESADRRAFEAAVAAAGTTFNKKYQEGDLVSGTIAKITPDVVLVSLGGKSEALMDLHELDGEKAGDLIEAVVVKAGPEVRLSRKLAAGKRTQAELRAAYQARIPVAGKVVSRNKGGFEVSIGGGPHGIRAFCPASQIDVGRHDEASLQAFVGQTFDFRVIEYTEDGRRVVVSRVVLLKEESEAKAEQVREHVVPGAVLTGRVRSITDFGAFVDLGGMDGLVHVTEISRKRVKHPKDVLTVGQEVQVKVTKVEKEGKRISLSMRELEKDPWESIGERWASGAPFQGSVARHADFGLFVEVEPGVDGLVHVSQLPAGIAIGDPSVAVGQQISGWVREVDAAARRLSLTMREASLVDPWDGIETKLPEGGLVNGEVENVAPFGVFVRLGEGLTGLIPNSETGIPHGAAVNKAFSPGQKLDVKVIGLDKEKRRISLSVTKAKDDADRREMRKYREDSAKRERESTEQKGGVSVFGASLLAAIQSPRKNQKGTK